MQSTWRIRLRTPWGNVVVSQDQGPSKIGELRLCIAQAIREKRRVADASGRKGKGGKGKRTANDRGDDTFRIKVGFPPRTLTANVEDEVGEHVRSGDTLIITTETPSTHFSSPVPGPKAEDKGKRRKRTREKSPVKRKVGVHSLRGAEKPSNPRKRKKKARGIVLHSKADVESRLVNSVSGARRDLVSQFFRSATRRAVAKAYERSLALRRFASSLQRDFTITMSENSRRLADGAPTSMTVRFRKGPRSYEEEEVPVLTKEEMRSAFDVVINSESDSVREQLKPANMAQCSPRVFWGIVHHFATDLAISSEDDRDIVAKALRNMFPDADLSFLTHRRRTLTEKAKVNLQRQHESLRRKAAASMKRKERLKREAENGSAETAKAKISKGKAEVVEITPLSVEDIVGPSMAARLSTLGIASIDNLASQECAQVKLRDASVNRENLRQGIEDARQEMILRVMGVILGESSGDELSSDSEVQEVPPLSAEISPLVCALQEVGIVSPRDLTLLRAPALLQKVRAPSSSDAAKLLQSVDLSRIATWRMRAWTQLATRPWLTDYSFDQGDE